MEEIKYSSKNDRNRKHPYEKANIASKTCFCWILPYFVRGFKKELSEDDMYETLKSHESSRLGDKLQSAWNHEVSNKKDPSLWMATIRVFGFELLLYAIIFVFSELIVMLCQPIIISKLLTFYEPNQTEMTKDDACVYAALLTLVTLMRVILRHAYMHQSMQLSLKIKVAACSLIYRKALKLSKSALVDTTIGQMVNLLANDVSRFNDATQHVNYLWLAPLETFIVMYLLYVGIGIVALSGTIFILLFIPFQLYMGRRASHFRLKTALRTDERVRLMSEIVTGIQIIKMYTWEKPFAKLVELSRKKEMKQIWYAGVIRGLALTLNAVLNRAAICISILTFVLTGNTITATYAYTISTYYATLREAIRCFPKAVIELAETRVSVFRIRKFLLYDEIKQDEDSSDFKHLKLQKVSAMETSFKEEIVGIHLKNISAKWVQSMPDNTLRNLTFDAESSQLTAIIGPVGSGKTTLFHIILKELSPVEGFISIQGIISYASQEPWLFGGSVRQNIIFGQEFIAKKYEEVVRVCALERDFTLMPYGDQTIVGDRGTTLSGGQRARINLARAVYKDADIYLLDDPLSAVDTQVGKQLFDECICGYLKNKCVVLATHQLQYLKNVENIYLIQDGRVYTSGSYSELESSNIEFLKLLESESDKERDEELSTAIYKKSKQIKTEKQNTATRYIPFQQKEQINVGDISWKVYYSYFRAGGNWCKIVLLMLSLIVSILSGCATEYFVKVWVNLEQWRLRHNNATATNSSVESLQQSTWQETMQLGYDQFLTEDKTVLIYACLALGTIIIVIAKSIAFFRFCATASTKLHNFMFNKIVFAPMRFFTINPPGRILNRFSKDMGAVDELLPLCLLDTLETILSVLAITLVVGSLNPWILIPTVVILVIFYYLRVIFLATTRDLKRIEATTRSPIYTHLSASLQGLTTIRAFGAQDILKNEFDNYQDKNTSPNHMFISASRTLGFWLDFLCVVYIALVTISILFIEKEMLGGNVGLALTQSINLTGMIQWGIRQWSELEINMTAVERVEEYIQLAPEKNNKIQNLPRFWPEDGVIKFEKMSLRYSPEDPYVLKDLTFEIKSNEKIGIVGRTGAGKSSLISALFRLTNIDGSIIIDNVNTQDIPLNILRSKISIIPQEPVLFSGTLRKNLDPFDEYNDEVLWNALNEVELKQVVSGLAGTLDSKVSEGGSNFSVGQRQLLCLARSIIRNNKILVLDEATANVDPQTDGLIQTTIRRKFANCTVLTVAHRLHTIMDSDKVLVMDAGKVAEFGHPHVLLQNTTGVFYALVMESGTGMAENLISIAEENFKNLSNEF